MDKRQMKIGAAEDDFGVSQRSAKMGYSKFHVVAIMSSEDYFYFINTFIIIFIIIDLDQYEIANFIFLAGSETPWQIASPSSSFL